MTGFVLFRKIILGFSGNGLILDPRLREGPMNSVMSVSQFVCSSVRTYLGNGSKDFSNFLHEVREQQGKETDFPFLGQKGSKMAQKWIFFYFCEKSALRILLKMPQMKDIIVLYHSAKTACPKKVWFSSTGPKSSRPIRLLHS